MKYDSGSLGQKGGGGEMLAYTAQGEEKGRRSLEGEDKKRSVP